MRGIHYTSTYVQQYLQLKDHERYNVICVKVSYLSKIQQRSMYEWLINSLGLDLRAGICYVVFSSASAIMGAWLVRAICIR